MKDNHKPRITLDTLAGLSVSSRREFLKKMTLGSGGILLADRILLKQIYAQTEQDKTIYSMIVVDFNKCTGCRTCETVCSSFNNTVSVNGKDLPGLGNPHHANIRVYPFNPDVDVPVTCLMCDDAPCIKACPVEPDPKTGRRALYRQDTLPILHNDLERCIGCGSCAAACKEKRVGAIIPHPETNKPERMCTLCNGDPQCVKYCPFGALSYVVQSTKGKYYGTAPHDVARTLAELWYGQE